MIWWECCPGKGGLGEFVQGIPITSPPTTKKARSLCEKSHRLLAIFCVHAYLLYFGAIRELKAKEILTPQDFANLLQLFYCEGTAFELLVKVGGGCTHLASQSCLAHALVRQGHTDFLLHCHGYHLLDSIAHFTK